MPDAWIDKGITMLEVAYRRCDRRGRLSIARLISAEPCCAPLRCGGRI